MLLEFILIKSIQLLSSLQKMYKFKKKILLALTFSNSYFFTLNAILSKLTISSS